MFFRLPIVKFFSRLLNRATITVALVLLQAGWLLWAFSYLTTGRIWVNAAVAGEAAVSNNNTIEGSLLGADAAQTNLNCHGNILQKFLVPRFAGIKSICTTPQRGVYRNYFMPLKAPGLPIRPPSLRANPLGLFLNCFIIFCIISNCLSSLLTSDT